MLPAANDQPTREALAALQASSLRWLIGGVVSVVLGVLLWFAVVALEESTGHRYPASGLVVLILVTLGGILAVAGGGSLLRTRRWGRALSRTGWQDGRLRVTGPGHLDFQPAGHEDGEEPPVKLRLLSTAVWRTRAVHRLHGADVRAAPVSDAEWVLTADGHATLYGARVTAPRG